MNCLPKRSPIQPRKAFRSHCTFNAINRTFIIVLHLQIISIPDYFKDPCLYYLKTTFDQLHRSENKSTSESGAHSSYNHSHHGHFIFFWMLEHLLHDSEAKWKVRTSFRILRRIYPKNNVATSKPAPIRGVDNPL